MEEEREELSPRQRELVRETVHETLLSLGVDAGSPNSVIEVQRDFAYLRAMRKNMAGFSARAFGAGIIVVVTGLAAALLAGLQQVFSTPHH